MTFPYQPTSWLITDLDVVGDPNVFPLLPGRTFLSEKGPSWNTITKKAASGRQVRCSLQSTPIWQFKVAYEFLRDLPPTKEELATLWAFFNTRQGQFGSFFYFDPTDNQVLNQQIGVGDGVTNSFQLTRTVAPGTPYAFVDAVYAVNGTPTVMVGGASTSAFTLAEGMLTFSTAPAAGAPIVWSGSFMFWCHFTQDKVAPAQKMKGIWTLTDGLTFESLLP